MVGRKDNKKKRSSPFLRQSHDSYGGSYNGIVFVDAFPQVAI